LDPTEPYPRDEAAPVVAWQPREIARRDIPAATGEARDTFRAVLERRRSNPSSDHLAIEALGALLWDGARVRETSGGRLAVPSSRRPAPSAGGIHPIEIFVRVAGEARVERYDPFAHALASVEVLHPDHLAAFDRQVAAAVPNAGGSIMAFIADTSRTAAAYERSESLIWRDAGCLMMTLHLVAESLGLAFSPVGVLGTALARALAAPEGWIAAGTCVVGTRADRD